MGMTGRLLLRGLVWGSVLVGCLPQAALAQKTVSTGTGRSPAPVRAAEEQEDAQEELYVPSGPDHGFSFDGNFRYLYGQGHMEGKTLNPRTGKQDYFKQMMLMQTLRTRLYLNYHLNKNWKIITGVEDNRVLNDQSLTDTAHIHRAFVEGEDTHYKARAGRFGYIVNNGNVLDTTMDGVRFGYGRRHDYWLTAFWGRTGSSSGRREGVILDALKQWGPWETQVGYYDFRNLHNEQHTWDKQKILSAELRYRFAPDISLGWEYLQAAGSDRGQSVPSDHGFVVNLNYKDYDYKKPGSYRLRLRYYREPQAAVITHTMDGWPGFFDLSGQKMGFEGYGICWDYVLRKGVALTLEGYDLCNYRDGQYAGDFRQKILGGTLTFAL